MNHYDEMSESIYQKHQEQKKRKKRKLTVLTSVSTVALASVLTVTAFLGTAGGYTAKKISTERAYADTVSFSTEAMQAYIRFAGKTFEKIKLETNTLYSPISLFLGLALLTNGSNGETKTELLSLLDMSEQAVYDLSSSILDYYHKLNPVDVQNSIWIKKDFSVKEQFLKDNSIFFGNDIFVAPFDQSTVKDINRWVEKATNGQIKKIIDSIAPEIAMHIINSIHLEARWLDQFSRTYERFFHAKDGDKQVSMLERTYHVYYDSGNALAFTHTLENGVYFMGILPNSDDYTLDGDEIYALFNGIKVGDERYCYDVYTSLPTFSYENDLDLKDNLNSLGLGHLFADADFSNISNENLYVDNIKQKTKIELDKDGIKASAVLDIFMDAQSAMLEGERRVVFIDLDRPFYYMIYTIPDYEDYDLNQTVLPMFMGYVADPTK